MHSDQGNAEQLLACSPEWLLETCMFSHSKRHMHTWSLYQQTKLCARQPLHEKTMFKALCADRTKRAFFSRMLRARSFSSSAFFLLACAAISLKIIMYYAAVSHSKAHTHCFTSTTV